MGCYLAFENKTSQTVHTSHVIRLCRNLNRAAFMGSQINVQISQVKVQKLFIGQLADDATNQEIAELFERFGAKVTSPLIYPLSVR